MTDGNEDLHFEWDHEKSAVNLEKHGIDFATARRLWDDPNEVTGPLAFAPEERFMTVARLLGRTWSAVHTYRKGRIRIISVRRSRFHESVAYEQAVYERTKLP